MNNSSLNPALQDIKELFGTWEMELSNASFLPDPTTTKKGTASFERLEGVDLLILRQGLKESGDAWTTWFISRYQNTGNYTILHTDDRRISRVCEISFENGTWKIKRNVPEFTQRFFGKISTDNEMIEGHW